MLPAGLSGWPGVLSAELAARECASAPGPGAAAGGCSAGLVLNPLAARVSSALLTFVVFSHSRTHTQNLGLAFF